jgi:phenylalanine ammonia-lyase
MDGYRSHTLLPAPQALQVAGITPILLSSKEHLGILNGTAFSAAVSALVVRGARGMGVLGAVSHFYYLLFVILHETDISARVYRS